MSLAAPLLFDASWFDSDNLGRHGGRPLLTGSGKTLGY